MMFESEKDDLIEALNAADQPLTVETAAERIGDDIDVVRTVVASDGQTVKQNDETWILVVDDEIDYDMGDIPSAGSSRNGSGSNTSTDEDEDEDDAETDADQADAESSTDDTQTDGGAQPQPVDHTVDPTHTSAQSDALDLYQIGELRCPDCPEEMLVGEPTGDHWRGGSHWNGLPILSNGRDNTPSEHVSYYPVEVGDTGKTTEDWTARTLGELYQPLLLEGEAGTGKNRLINRAAAATNRPVQRIAFGGGMSLFDLVGEKDIENGQSYYILGKLAKAVIFGHLAILDEINMAPGDLTSYLHSVTEKAGNRSLELTGTGITLIDIPVEDDAIAEHGSWYKAAREKWTAEEHLGKYIHPEFRVTATCNPLDYASTKSMNGAFRDRFVVVEHPYLPPGPEAKLLAEETGCDPDAVQPLCRCASELRSMKDAGKLSCPITHRTLAKTVEMAGPDEEWLSFEESAREIFVKHAAEPRDRQEINDALDDEL